MSRASTATPGRRNIGIRSTSPMKNRPYSRLELELEKRPNQPISRLVDRYKQTNGASCPYAGTASPKRPMHHSNGAKPHWNSSTNLFPENESTDVQFVISTRGYKLKNRGSKHMVSREIISMPQQLGGQDSGSLAGAQAELFCVPNQPLTQTSLINEKSQEKGPIETKVSVHIVSVVGFQIPCDPRVCQHDMQHFMDVQVGDVKKRIKSSIEVSRSPVWSSQCVEFDLSQTMKHVGIRLSTKCTRKSVLLGEGVMALNREKPIEQYLTLYRQLPRQKQRVIAGKLKIRLTYTKLEPKVERPVRPPFMGGLGNDLLAAKANLKKTETKLPTIANKNGTTKEHDAYRRKSVAFYESLKETVEKQSHQITDKDVKVLRQVGEGLHACVKHAQWILDTTEDADADSYMDIALKEFQYLKKPPPMPVMENFQHEYELLQKLDHPNVVKLLGVYCKPRLTIVTEYMNGKSLYHTMNEKTWKSVDWSQKLQIGIQVVQGLVYLHDHNILHRDIKSHNILVAKINDKISAVKVADLGSAVQFQSSRDFITEEHGTSGYTAPEVFSSQGYSFPADVWSVGILLWEIMAMNTSEHWNPFTGLDTDVFCAKAQSIMNCPRFPSSIPSSYRTLVMSCWAFAPSERPSMATLLQRLQALK